MLASAVSAHQKDWDEHLPYLMMAYRSSRHESTGETPNSMMLGREVSLPIDIMMGSPEDEQPLEGNEYAADLRQKMENAFEHVRVNLNKEQCRQKRLYDRRRNGSPYTIGDVVWLWNPVRRKGFSPKLQRN
jgi:hypothetical protein